MLLRFIGLFLLFVFEDGNARPAFSGARARGYMARIVAIRGVDAAPLRPSIETRTTCLPMVT
jgi:hypothetical protein